MILKFEDDSCLYFVSIWIWNFSFFCSSLVNYLRLIVILHFFYQILNYLIVLLYDVIVFLIDEEEYEYKINNEVEIRASRSWN